MRLPTTKPRKSPLPEKLRPSWSLTRGRGRNTSRQRTGLGAMMREIAVVDAVTVLAGRVRIILAKRVHRRDAVDQMLGPDLGLIARLRLEQVVQVQGVLRLIIATDVAIGAIHAR